jgi:hypothetical protein
MAWSHQRRDIINAYEPRRRELSKICSRGC